MELLSLLLRCDLFPLNVVYVYYHIFFCVSVIVGGQLWRILW